MARGRTYNGCSIAFAIALCAAPILIYLLFWGNTTGEEFSPTDFSRRRFSYNKMPIFGIILQGVTTSDVTPVFAQALKSDGLIGQNTSQNPRWHLVSDNVSDASSSDFDAKFLTRYLDLTDENGESIWFAWNELHPDLAKKFWPVISSLAEEYLYLDVGDLMLRAMSLKADDRDNFESWFLSETANALEKEGARLELDGEYDGAIRLYSKAIEILPSSELYKKRAGMFEKVGDTQKYQNDLDAGKSLE